MMFRALPSPECSHCLRFPNLSTGTLTRSSTISSYLNMPSLPFTYKKTEALPSVSSALPVICPLVSLLPSPLPRRSQAHNKAPLDHRWGQADPAQAHPSPCVQPYQSKTSCLFSPDQLSETEPTSGALTDRLGSRASGFTRRGAGLA